MKKVFIFAIILTLGICLTVPAMAAKYTMKIGHAGPGVFLGKVHEPSLAMKSYIEKHSGGQIEVQIFPGGQLGTFRDMMEQVQANTLEVCQTAVGGVTGFFPEFEVVDMPYAFKNELVSEFFSYWSPFWEDISNAMLKKTGNIRLANVGRGAYRNFITSSKPIYKVADMKGLKIRTIQSELHQNLVKMLGANPTPMPWSDVYTSLQTGVVDGTKNACFDVTSAKMVPPLKYAILDGHSVLYDFFWVSEKWLKSLPEELQKVVTGGLRMGGRYATQMYWLLAKEGQKTFKKKGKKVIVPTPEAMEGFRAVSKPLQDWFAKRYGDYWLKKFLHAVEEAERKAGAY